MKRTVVRLALFVLAAALGWGASEMILRTRLGRETIAHFVETGAGLRIEKNLRLAAAGETADETIVAHEIEALRGRFGDDASFNEALRQGNLSLGELHNRIAENLRERAWIEQQIAPQLRVTNEDLRAFYDSNRAEFQLPFRWRAKHLFLAAPDGYPDDLIRGKRSEIEALSIRRIDGEPFGKLITEASEDEATKTRGGDLNWFSSARMPPEFIAAIKPLRAGEVSGPIRSHLGFHLVQVTETKPERAMTFEQARPEIELALANQRRALAVAALRQRLSTPEFAPH